MNTTKKGDTLEDRVFFILRDLLSNGDFFVNGKNSKIFKKKGYYSKDRNSKIITDISIETFMPDAVDYSILTIIECKNLNHNVPVDDVEEFDSKIRQIGEHNTKGIIFTRLGFQKSAFTVGNSKKIGLCVVEDKDKLHWISHRAEKNKSVISQSIVKRIVGESRSDLNFCAYHKNKTYDNIPNLLIACGIIDYYKQKAKYINVKYLSDKEISNKISEVVSNHNFYDNSLNFDKLCKYLSEEHKVTFKFDENLENSILGKVVYANKTISIDKDLKKDITKWRFTLAHEIGHFVLHQQYSLTETNDNEIDINVLSDSSQNERMEIQANIFTSQLLIPEEPLNRLAQSYFSEERLHKGYLYLDHQLCNQALVMRFLYQLQMHFNVSKSVAKYRLISCGLLRDETDNSIKSIMRKNPNG